MRAATDILLAPGSQIYPRLTLLLRILCYGPSDTCSNLYPCDRFFYRAVMMRLPVRLICVLVLFCFTASSSLAAAAGCCSRLAESTKPGPAEEMIDHCHPPESSDAPGTSSPSCCQDMSLCNGLSVYVGNALLTVSGIKFKNARPIPDEAPPLTILTPPTPPPKS